MFGFSGIKKEHMIGVVIGVGVAATGYYFYKKNQDKVDKFLREQGVNINSNRGENYETMDIEKLTEIKEHLEDLIAEKELETETVDQPVVIVEE